MALLFKEGSGDATLTRELNKGTGKLLNPAEAKGKKFVIDESKRYRKTGNGDELEAYDPNNKSHDVNDFTLSGASHLVDENAPEHLRSKRENQLRNLEKFQDKGLTFDQSGKGYDNEGKRLGKYSREELRGLGKDVYGKGFLGLGIGRGKKVENALKENRDLFKTYGGNMIYQKGYGDSPQVEKKIETPKEENNASPELATQPTISNSYDEFKGKKGDPYSYRAIKNGNDVVNYQYKKDGQDWTNSNQDEEGKYFGRQQAIGNLYKEYKNDPGSFTGLSVKKKSKAPVNNDGKKLTDVKTTKVDTTVKNTSTINPEGGSLYDRTAAEQAAVQKAYAGYKPEFFAKAKENKYSDHDANAIWNEVLSGYKNRPLQDTATELGNKWMLDNTEDPFESTANVRPLKHPKAKGYGLIHDNDNFNSGKKSIMKEVLYPGNNGKQQRYYRPAEEEEIAGLPQELRNAMGFKRKGGKLLFKKGGILRFEKGGLSEYEKQLLAERYVGKKTQPTQEIKKENTSSERRVPMKRLERLENRVVGSQGNDTALSNALKWTGTGIDLVGSGISYVPVIGNAVGGVTSILGNAVKHAGNALDREGYTSDDAKELALDTALTGAQFIPFASWAAGAGKIAKGVKTLSGLSRVAKGVDNAVGLNKIAKVVAPVASRIPGVVGNLGKAGIGAYTGIQGVSGAKTLYDMANDGQSHTQQEYRDAVNQAGQLIPAQAFARNAGKNLFATGKKGYEAGKNILKGVKERYNAPDLDDAEVMLGKKVTNIPAAQQAAAAIPTPAVPTTPVASAVAPAVVPPTPVAPVISPTPVAAPVVMATPSTPVVPPVTASAPTTPSVPVTPSLPKPPPHEPIEELNKLAKTLGIPEDMIVHHKKEVEDYLKGTINHVEQLAEKLKNKSEKLSLMADAGDTGKAFDDETLAYQRMKAEYQKAHQKTLEHQLSALEGFNKAGSPINIKDRTGVAPVNPLGTDSGIDPAVYTMAGKKVKAATMKETEAKIQAVLNDPNTPKELRQALELVEVKHAPYIKSISNKIYNNKSKNAFSKRIAEDEHLDAQSHLLNSQNKIVERYQTHPEEFTNNLGMVIDRYEPNYQTINPHNKNYIESLDKKYNDKYTTKTGVELEPLSVTIPIRFNAASEAIQNHIDSIKGLKGAKQAKALEAVQELNKAQTLLNHMKAKNYFKGTTAYNYTTQEAMNKVEHHIKNFEELLKSTNKSKKVNPLDAALITTTKKLGGKLFASGGINKYEDGASVLNRLKPTQINNPFQKKKFEPTIKALDDKFNAANHQVDQVEENVNQNKIAPREDRAYGNGEANDNLIYGGGDDGNQNGASSYGASSEPNQETGDEQTKEQSFDDLLNSVKKPGLTGSDIGTLGLGVYNLLNPLKTSPTQYQRHDRIINPASGMEYGLKQNSQNQLAANSRLAINQLANTSDPNTSTAGILGAQSNLNRQTNELNVNDAALLKQDRQREKEELNQNQIEKDDFNNKNADNAAQADRLNKAAKQQAINGLAFTGINMLRDKEDQQQQIRGQITGKYNQSLAEQHQDQYEDARRAHTQLANRIYNAGSITEKDGKHYDASGNEVTDKNLINDYNSRDKLNEEYKGSLNNLNTFHDNYNKGLVSRYTNQANSLNKGLHINNPFKRKQTNNEDAFKKGGKVKQIEITEKLAEGDPKTQLEQAKLHLEAVKINNERSARDLDRAQRFLFKMLEAFPRYKK
jgi:hypothetical protein